MSIYGIFLKNARTYIPPVLLTVAYLVMSGIYPTRRFLIEYAFVFKGVFLTLCLLAAGRCLNAMHRTSKVFNGLIIWFGLAMIASVFTSHYYKSLSCSCRQRRRYSVGVICPQLSFLDIQRCIDEK